MECEISAADLSFLAGNFLYGDFPDSKSYLLKYFKTKKERILVGYLLSPLGLEFKSLIRFGVYRRITDHTGVIFSERWYQMLLSRLKKLESELARALAEQDLEMIGIIRNGQYKDLPYTKSRHKKR